MTKQKTPIQQAIEEIQSLNETGRYTKTSILGILAKYLPAERAIIEQAYREGALDAEADSLGWNKLHGTASDYFNQIFEQDNQ